MSRSPPPPPPRSADAVDVGSGLVRRLGSDLGLLTVPQIWIGERHVGGFDEMRALEQAGELDPLLEAAAS